MCIQLTRGAGHRQAQADGPACTFLLFRTSSSLVLSKRRDDVRTEDVSSSSLPCPAEISHRSPGLPIFAPSFAQELRDESTECGTAFISS